MFAYIIRGLFAFRFTRRVGGYSVAASLRGVGTWSSAGCWPGWELRRVHPFAPDWWCEWDD